MKTTCSLFFILFFVATAYGQIPTANFTASPLSGCAPLVVDFKDASGGNPTTWYWDFGNGSTSTLKNPSTAYFTPGTYTVKLTVTNAAGSNTMTRTNLITIYGKPTIAFKVSDSAGCFPLKARFTDSSTAAAGTRNTAWVWDFGDGIQSNQQNPLHVYTTAGNFSVTLKVTNDKGCYAVATKPQYIKIHDGVNADFSYTTTGVCHAPFTVNFTNTSTGNGGAQYFWDFGDGDTSRLASPTHTYTRNGSFTVRLIATSGSGCADTLTKTNLFNFQPITTSISAPAVTCINDSVHFLNASTPTPVAATWDLGDGSSSNVLNPTKLYSAPGTYTVKLLNDYGYCRDTASTSIQIAPRPKASFSAPDTFSCKPPFTVTFRDASAGAAKWQWDFGDGGTSAAQNPSHTYTSYGAFTVKLTVTSAAGCTDTVRKDSFILVTKPLINFPGLPQTGCIPFTNAFTAAVNTQDVVTSYLWNFGDGTTSTAKAPSHTYTQQGTYTVALTITTGTGCTITDSVSKAIKVGRIPTVDFSAAPNPVCAFEPVHFIDKSNEADEWLWQFGDGAGSSEQNPTHTYTDTGRFYVTLTAINNGCKNALTKDIIQVKPPIAKYEVTADCSNRLRFNFIDKSIGPLTWNWDFGDGTTSTEQNPTHVFPSFKTYTVTLTVTNGSCSHFQTQTVKVINEKPDFTANPTVACKRAEVAFAVINSNPQNLVNYTWNFGEGSPQSTSSTTYNYIYSTAGTFNVSLETTDIWGCTYTVPSKSIRINGPSADFRGVNTGGCKGLTATFDDISRNDGINKIVNWRWDFGDGAIVTKTSNTPTQHFYPNTGSFTVKLIVTDALGCKDSMTRENLVNTTRPVANFTSDTLACPGSTINFTNTSDALNYTSTWTFGDAGGATDNSPSHAYTDTGHYTVSLAIMDQYGCPDTIKRTNYITVKRPTASFTVSDSVSSCAPLEVHFTNTSDYFSSVVWDLAGGISTVQNPTQFYVNPGTYPITLVAISPGGCTDTAISTIHVYDTLGTSLKYSPLEGCKPLGVNLLASSNGHMRYTWDFGDGVVLTQTTDTLQHVYNAFGNFVPKIIMTDNSGCIIPVVGLDTIRIIGAIAKFGLDRKLFCDSGMVSFLDSTTYNDTLTSYQWNFGDGATSGVREPQHYYSTPGLYTISLNVRTEHNCVDTFTLKDILRVVESPSVRIGGDSVICVNEQMTHLGEFLRPDSSTVQWRWRFPNGNTSAQQDPAKQQYGTAGDFVVTTTVMNSSGCVDTATRNIHVNALPTVTMPSTMTIQSGFPELIPATYSSGVVSYNWRPATGLSCTDCPQPTAGPKFDTRYIVDFVDSNGCRNSSVIHIVTLCKNANVFLPNTFSPNGDGNNDMFYVRGKGLERVKTLRIFNRWGEVVFEQNNFPVNNPSYGWNGKYKGNKPTPDVYVYQVEVFCENSQIIRFEGNVALIQ